eukprot:TRINITY_DN1699_c0_g1_i1.p1 TRINITY_DN1699_c0_g1~~TRINITY_DN1699_c0_g1_i1.p1  ORF type:complete len:250 (+),score=32.56 TRINITY_DN1699_c0_g1_i1:164-913(+)
MVEVAPLSLSLRRRRSGALAEKQWTVGMFKKPYGNLSSKYNVLNVIGDGSSAVVRLCEDRRTGELCAVKTIEKKKLVHQALAEAVQDEASGMVALSGCNKTVQLLEIIEDSRAVHLVMEYCARGDLFGVLESTKRVPEKLTACIVSGIAEALIDIHSRGYVHRDVKLENVFIRDSDANHILQEPNICVGDFGIARKLQPGESLVGCVGSPYSIAPEVLDGAYGFEADVEHRHNTVHSPLWPSTILGTNK